MLEPSSPGVQSFLIRACSFIRETRVINISSIYSVGLKYSARPLCSDIDVNSTREQNSSFLYTQVTNCIATILRIGTTPILSIEF